MRINGFQFGHLFTKRFYWLFWAAFKYQITGNPSLVSNGVNFIGVGGAYPNRDLWGKEYRVFKLGNIFGATILMYQPRPPPINPFSLPVPIQKWNQVLTIGQLSL